MKKYPQLLSLVCIVSALAGCAGTPKQEPKNILVWDSSREAVEKAEADSRPRLVLTPEESALVRGQWSEESDLALRDSSVPSDAREKMIWIVILSGITNEDLCNSYKLTSIEKLKLQHSEVATASQGTMKFNPVAYSEIWSVNTCGKPRKWLVADHEGDFNVHAQLPN